MKRYRKSRFRTHLSLRGGEELINVRAAPMNLYNYDDYVKSGQMFFAESPEVIGTLLLFSDEIEEEE